MHGSCGGKLPDIIQEVPGMRSVVFEATLLVNTFRGMMVRCRNLYLLEVLRLTSHLPYI
jgi:hypothetical protein